MAIWLCRAGKHGEYENKFFEENRIYCTWEGLNASLKEFSDRSELHDFFMFEREDIKPKTATNWVSQVWPFAYEMKKGDWVMLPSKVKPVIHIGKIIGDYTFDKEATDPFYHYREVDWFKKGVPKSAFEQDILYSLGAFLTICRIKQEERIKSIVTGVKPEKTNTPILEEQDEIEDIVQRDIELDAFDNIKDLLIRKFKGHGMAKVVASILRAKGFVTYVSPEGPDKGVDILAAQGSLGFDSPKLCVQVKSTDNPVDRPTLDQLIGSMSNFKADYGLLVSWSGFKSSVINETASQFFKVRFWTHKEIVEEFLENYEKLDDEIKLEIPLKRIWVINNAD
ncbi:MAG: restriction endonuclease [Bacillota bacterium]|nr:restriction endonuclease [Bacillota bacterium]